MFVITGATGALGRAIVQQLITRVSPAAIVASVRDPSKAADLGVPSRQADFGDPASVARAFEGATKVLIVSVPLPTHIAVPQHRTAIDAARAAGVQRILYTSQMGADPNSAFSPMHTHAATEELLRSSGVPFTALRNGFYVSSAKGMFGRMIAAGEIVAPADGPIAWTTHADLAEAAAVALTSDVLDGITPPLTATTAVTLDELAAIAKVKRTVISDDEYRDRLVKAGTPPPVAAMLTGIFEASRKGAFARTDPTLARVIGHPPIELAEALHSPIAT